LKAGLILQKEQPTGNTRKQREEHAVAYRDVTHARTGYPEQHCDGDQSQKKSNEDSASIFHGWILI
jgi:hypothetical protein